MSTHIPPLTVPAPTLSTISPSQGGVSGGTSVTLTGTNLTSATAVKFGAVAAASFSVVSDSTIVAVSPPGGGTVLATVTTAGGTSNGLGFTYRPIPTLSGVAPAQGPLTGGESVVLTGANLTGTTSVRFGSFTATSFLVVSDTQITASVPVGIAGPVVVSVTTVGGTSAENVYFYYVAAPTLSSVVPNQGPESGGTSVTLTGSHFTAASAVTFGSAAATSFTVVSDTEITALVPAGTAGSVSVSVSTVGGTSNSLSYTYLSAPVLVSLAPNQGPQSGGASVTLTGSQLTTAGAVTFGGTLASFTVISDTTVVAISPPGSGSVQVAVTTDGGTSNSLAYTFVAPPAI